MVQMTGMLAHVILAALLAYRAQVSEILASIHENVFFEQKYETTNTSQRINLYGIYVNSVYI